MKKKIIAWAVAVAAVLGIYASVQAATPGIPITVPSAASAGYMLTSTVGGTYQASSTERLTIGSLNATSTKNSTFMGKLSVASSTPWGQLSVNPNALGSGVPEFVIGSSTLSHLVVEGSGRLVTRISTTGLNQEFQRWTTSDDSKFAAIQQDASDGFLTMGAQSSNTNFNLAAGGQRVLTLYSASGSVIRAGVGTTTPTGFFSVEEPSVANNPYVVFVGDQGTSSPMFAIMPNTLSGFGTTSPWGFVSINPNGQGSGVPEFVVGSSTITHFMIDGSGQATFNSALTDANVILNTTGTSEYIYQRSGATNKSYWGWDGSNNVFLQASSGLGLQLQTNALTAIYINTSQKVGIGSSTPTQILSVQGNAIISGNITSVANITATGTMTISNGGLSVPSIVGSDADSGICFGGCGQGAKAVEFVQDGVLQWAFIGGSLAGSGSRTIRTDGNLTVQVGAGGSITALTIPSATGNAGFGTTSPSQVLSVQGGAIISGDITSVANITATGTAKISGNISGAGGAAAVIPYASSTSATISGTPYITTHKGFSYATTTTWTATTTIFLEVAYGETWNSGRCSTDAGTLNIDFYHASSHLNLLNASTTMGTFTFSTNNAMTAGDLVKVDIGTPATSPLKIVCTLNMNTQ